MTNSNIASHSLFRLPAPDGHPSTRLASTSQSMATSPRNSSKVEEHLPIPTLLCKSFRDISSSAAAAPWYGSGVCIPWERSEGGGREGERGVSQLRGFVCMLGSKLVRSPQTAQPRQQCPQQCPPQCQCPQQCPQPCPQQCTLSPRGPKRNSV